MVHDIHCVPPQGRSTPPAVPERAAQWEIFVEGDALYDAMMRDIASATTNIRMESYIFASDVVGRRIAGALTAQARRGRRVDLRVDYAGSRLELDETLVRELRATGVRFEWSRRWEWLKPWEFHRRNHRKLLVVDDAIAYTGGFNVHAVSSRRAVGASRWRDSHVRFEGPAVRQAADIFDGSSDGAPNHRGAASPLSLIPNTTRRCRWRLRCEFDRVMGAARERIWLTTPYFIPDRRLLRRLVHAARRGVDVRVLTPAKSDVSIARWAARASYARLLQHGVRLYEYQPRILHAKTMLVDDTWATLGTANFDYRSLFVNAEVNVIARSKRFCEDLAQHFCADLESSCEVRLEDLGQWSWWGRVREAFAWRLRRWL